MIELAIAMMTGGCLGAAIVLWRTGTNPTQKDLAWQNIALYFTAQACLQHADDAEREEIEAEIDEKMKAAFGDDAGFTMEEVDLDE